ncbi:MAG: hypothetical protein JNM66_17945, partial [Bryobacterales bacterium]|nr:hypothetical protein [Bryobacterales bacterium]
MSGRVVTYTMDDAGRPKSALSGSTNYVSSATYAPHGAARTLKLGGTTALQAQWGTFNGKLQLEGFTVSKLSAPAATLLTLGYGYGGTSNNGNPVSHTVSDGLSVRTQKFTYDAANRLATACEANVGSSTCTVTAGTTWTGLGYGQAYGYDSYSNRWVD